MPNTFEPIATYTLPSDTATYTFNSIPGSYTHLYIVVSILNPSSGGNGLDYYLAFNGDYSANYATTKMGATASTRGSNRVNAGNSMQLFYTVAGSNVGTWTTGEIWIPYYTSTVFQKNIQASGGGIPETGISSSFWNNTSAITSVGFSASNNFTSAPLMGAGSTFTLYGILKA
jgi:hypothetical protein